MLDELLQSVRRSLENGNARLLDLYINDACVGVWSRKKVVDEDMKNYIPFLYSHTDDVQPKGIVLSKKSPLRSVAERNGCQLIRAFMGQTEVDIFSIHKMFTHINEVYSFLDSVEPNSKFQMHCEKCKSYPAKDLLLVKASDVWLKFRADYSMYETPPTTITGTLEITPKENQKGFYHVGWSDEFSMYHPYDFTMKMSDIEVIEESDVVAELL